MSATKKLGILLVSFFVLFAVNHRALAGSASFEKHAMEVTSGDSGPLETISDAHGWHRLSVKGNEQFSSGYQNIPVGKKYMSTELSWRSDANFAAILSVYSLKRANSLGKIPIYIIFRRLTI